MSKTFNSFNAFRKHCFPQEYRREMEERAKARLGFGVWLAKRFLARMRAELKRA